MIIANHKPIRIVGYAESSMTHEFVNEISKTHTAEVIAPLNFAPDNGYQYIVAVTLDLAERKQIIDAVDQYELDLITVIHDTSLVGSTPPAKIGAGTFVFPFSTIALGASIGQHCIISPYSMLGHYSTIGRNCILRSGAMITDKSTVGNNCVFNIRSTVTNHVTVVDDVQLMAFANVAKDITVPGQYIGSTARKFIGS